MGSPVEGGLDEAVIHLGFSIEHIHIVTSIMKSHIRVDCGV